MITPGRAVTVALAPGKLAELAAEGGVELLACVTVSGQFWVHETLAMAVASPVPKGMASARRRHQRYERCNTENGNTLDSLQRGNRT